jgi:hypothetical protein
VEFLLPALSVFISAHQWFKRLLQGILNARQSDFDLVNHLWTLIVTHFGVVAFDNPSQFDTTSFMLLTTRVRTPCALCHRSSSAL